MATKKRSLIPYPDEVIPPLDHQRLRDELTNDLIEISKLSGEFSLTSFARDWGRGWYKDHNDPDLRPQHLVSKRFEGYLARKQTHIHKLAIILSAAQRDDRRIEAKDLEEACDIIEIMEKNMLRIFDYIGSPSQKGHTQEIVNTVAYFGWMTDQGLWYRCMNQMTRREYMDALDGAVKSGLVKVTIGTNGQMGVSVPQKGTKSP